MTKRLVDIDDELLQKAREVMDTATMKDTVNRALAEVIESDLRARHVLRLAEMDGLVLDDEATMARAWE